MRYIWLILPACLALTACASYSNDGAPTGYIAALQAAHLEQTQAAQLRNIRNAEARVVLARAKVDLTRTPDEDDARELLSAREALRQARSVYGPTETGYDDRSIFILRHSRHDRRLPGISGGYSGSLNTSSSSSSSAPSAQIPMRMRGN